MTEQIDIAVDMSVVPTAVPETGMQRQFAASPPVVAPQIIEGIPNQSCRMIRGGMSKSNKSYCRLNLGGGV